MYSSHFLALSTQLVQPSFPFGKLQFRFNMLTFSSPFMSGPNFYPSRSINFFRRHFLCLFERVAASFQSPSAAESLLVKLAQPNGFRQLQSSSISSRFLSDEEETRTLFWAFSCFFYFHENMELLGEPSVGVTMYQLIIITHCFISLKTVKFYSRCWPIVTPTDGTSEMYLCVHL